MSEKAKHCEDCNHFRYGYSEEHLCAKGNHPRFYKLKSIFDDDFGWKRRCEDFEPRDKAPKR